MLISGNNKLNQLKSRLETVYNFLLSEIQARAIFEKIIYPIKRHWEDVCEEAEFIKVDKKLLWGGQFLNVLSTE